MERGRRAQVLRISPGTAINQFEMWQSATFDTKTIERELALAQGRGFNSLRVFLHLLPFEDEHDAFMTNVGTFLDLVHQHEIGVMFVLFDGVWYPYRKSGPQPDPKPGVHNPGWL